MWVGPRVTMVMGEDILLALSRFSGKRENGVPAIALLVQLAVVAMLLMLTQSFKGVLRFHPVCVNVQLVPHGARGYRTKNTASRSAPALQGLGISGDTLNLFGVTLFVLAHLAAEDPVRCLESFGTMLAGFIIYAISVRHTRTAHRRTSWPMTFMNSLAKQLAFVFASPDFRCDGGEPSRRKDGG